MAGRPKKRARVEGRTIPPRGVSFRDQQQAAQEQARYRNPSGHRPLAPDAPARTREENTELRTDGPLGLSRPTRPVVLRPGVARTIVDAVASGVAPYAAALSVGVSQAAFTRWLRLGADGLARRDALLEAAVLSRGLENVEDLPFEDDDHVVACRELVEALLHAGAMARLGAEMRVYSGDARGWLTLSPSARVSGDVAWGRRDELDVKSEVKAEVRETRETRVLVAVAGEGVVDLMELTRPPENVITRIVRPAIESANGSKPAEGGDGQEEAS